MQSTVSGRAGSPRRTDRRMAAGRSGPVSKPFDITDGRNRYRPCPNCGAAEGMGLAWFRGTLAVECCYCGHRGPEIRGKPSAERDKAAFDGWNSPMRAGPVSEKRSAMTKPKQTGKPAKITVAELRDLRASLDDEQQSRIGLAEENRLVRQALDAFTSQVLQVRALLGQERDVLLTRVDALDIMLRILPAERAVDGQNTG